MAQMVIYTTNFRRLSLGLLVGLLVEAFILAPLAYFFYFDPDHFGRYLQPWDSIDGVISLLIWCAAWVGRVECLLAGAFGLGGIVWVMFHRAGRRSWPYAVFIGFGASFTCAFCWFLAAATLIQRSSLEPGTMAVVAALSAFFGVLGALGWALAWRVAYRNVENKIAAEAHFV